MANKLPAFHAPFPMRFMVDSRPSATASRLLGLYCWHDRLSLTKGTGSGCTASNKTLSARLGCDYTTLLKLRKGLEDWGYIETSRAGGQYRREVVRVIPDHLADPAKWPFDPAYIGSAALVAWGMDPAKAGEIASNSARNHGEAASHADSKAGEPLSENGGNLPKTADQHMLRSKETYFSEERKHIPLEEAHLCDARSQDEEISASSLGIDLGANRGEAKGKRDGEAGLSNDWLLAATLPKNFGALPLGAQVSKLDQAFTEIGRDPERLCSRERESLAEWMGAIFDEHLGGELDAVAQQANRLREELYLW